MTITTTIIILNYIWHLTLKDSLCSNSATRLYAENVWESGNTTVFLVYQGICCSRESVFRSAIMKISSWTIWKGCVRVCRRLRVTVSTTTGMESAETVNWAFTIWTTSVYSNVLKASLYRKRTATISCVVSAIVTVNRAVGSWRVCAPNAEKDYFLIVILPLAIDFVRTDSTRIRLIFNVSSVRQTAFHVLVRMLLRTVSAALKKVGSFFNKYL